MLKNIFKVNSRLSKSVTLITYPSVNFGMYRSNRELSKDFERERGEYNRAKKEMLKKHTQDFWEEQTKVENEWLENFTKLHKEKKFRDEAKLRNTIIKNSFACYQNIQQEIENQKAFIAKQKLWREEDTQQLLEKHSILTMLDRQAEEEWLTPDNIDTRLSQQMNQILPPTILSHVDYYKKLNTYATLLEQGYNKEAEELRLNKRIIEYKNKQLQPIYEELKTIIRHFTYTEEHSVFTLYKETLLRIDNYLVTKDTEKDFNVLKDNLAYLFKRLITLVREENEKPDNKLELVENQLKNLTMILVLWSRYVEIIYLPDVDVEKILDYKKASTEDSRPNDELTSQRPLEDLVDEKDPRVLKEYYFSKITEKRSKGSGLFVQDFRGLFDDVSIKRTYETRVKEIENQNSESKHLYEHKQNKQDYSSESDEETSKLAEDNKQEEQLHEEQKVKAESTKKTEGKKKRRSVHGEKRKLIENEAIEVFDESEEWDIEESDQTAQKKSEEKKTTPMQSSKSSTSQPEREINSSQSTTSASNTSKSDRSDRSDKSDKSGTKQENAINSLKKKESKLLEEFMLRQIKDQVKNAKVSKLDVAEEYSKYKSNLIKELGLNNEKELYGDIDKELEQVDLGQIIDINEFEVEIKKEQERLSLEKEFKESKTEDLFKSSLFNTIVKYSKDIFDFNNPKISTNLDIYDENLIRFLEYSVQESNLIYKSSSTSLIMEFIKEELKKISDDKLSPSNRLKKKHLIRVADICGRMRIPDSQNLKAVFDMFKHPAVKF